MLAVNKQFLDACSAANLEQIKKTLNQGANINARDEYNNNGLHCLAKINFYPNNRLDENTLKKIEDAIVFLLHSGINYQAKNSSKMPAAMNSNTPVERMVNRLIEDFEFNNKYAKKLLTEQTELLKNIHQQLDSQKTAIADTLKQLQQPLDFEKQKREFLERENQLLQKQLSLQMELDKLRQEKFESKQLSVKSESDTSNIKSTAQFFK